MKKIIAALLACSLLLAAQGSITFIATHAAEAGGGAALVTRALTWYYEPALGDEGNSAAIVDKSGGNYNLTLNGGAAWVTEGVHFDGVDDYAIGAAANDPNSLDGGDATVILIIRVEPGEVSCVPWTRANIAQSFQLALDSSGFFDVTFPLLFERTAASGTDDLRGSFIFLVIRTESGSQDVLYNGLNPYDSLAFSESVDDTAQKMIAGSATESLLFCDVILAGLFGYADNLTDAEVLDMYAYIKGAYPAGVTGDLP